MNTNRLKRVVLSLLAVVFTVAGILMSATLSLAVSTGGHDNRSKSFTVQDSDPIDFVKQGGISDSHTVNESFPVYVFITNNGQTKPLSLSTDVDLQLTLKGPNSEQTYALTISGGNTFGTVNITCPEPGTYTILISSTLDGQNIELTADIFTVGTPQVTGLVIEPNSSSIPVGGTENLKARLVLPSLHIDWDVTKLVWWSSDNSAIASVENWLPPNWAPGLVTGVSPGTTTIRASWFGLYSGSAQIVVTKPSLAITPLSAKINVGSSMQFYAYYTDGISPDPVDITQDSKAVWTSSNPLNPVLAGHVTAMNSGSTTITVTYQGMSKSADLTVVQPVLTVSGPKTAINVGESTPFQAFYTDATYQNQEVTTSVSWTSGNPAVASIGLQTGVAQGVGAGSVVLTAAYGTVTGTTTLRVVQPSLTVQLEKTRVNTGTTVLGKAVYTDAYHGSGLDVTASASWLSSAVNVAKIVTNGSIQALSEGTTDIQARYLGLSGVSQLTVIQPRLAMTPNQEVLVIGESVVFQAYYSDAEVSNSNVSSSASWASSNPSIASVNLGTVSGHASGTSMISAAFIGIKAEAQVTVLNLQAIKMLSIVPQTAAVDIGGTIQFTAYVINEDGSQTDVTKASAWSSSSAFVTVSQDGLAAGVSLSPLPATITATFKGISGTAALAVSTGGVIWEAEERPSQ